MTLRHLDPVIQWQSIISQTDGINKYTATTISKLAIGISLEDPEDASSQTLWSVDKYYQKTRCHIPKYLNFYQHQNNTFRYTINYYFVRPASVINRITHILYVIDGRCLFFTHVLIIVSQYLKHSWGTHKSAPWNCRSLFSFQSHLIMTYKLQTSYLIP